MNSQSFFFGCQLNFISLDLPLIRGVGVGHFADRWLICSDLIKCLACFSRGVCIFTRISSVN